MLIFSDLSVPVWSAPFPIPANAPADIYAWKCLTGWKREITSLLLVSKSWCHNIRQSIIFNNPIEKLICSAPENLVYDGITFLLQRPQSQQLQKTVFCSTCKESISFLDELLIRATQRALLSCMELLFNAGANASLRIPLVCIGLVSLAQIDEQSWVAIREDAGETRHEKKFAVLRLLLAYNAATELTSVVQTYDETYNNTPLAYAIRNGWVDIAELLLQHGAAYPSEIHNEYAPLEPLRYCAWRGQEEMLRMLFRNGVTMDNSRYEYYGPEEGIYSQEEHPLEWAISSGDLGTVRLLLEMGARTRDMEATVMWHTKDSSEEMKRLVEGYIQGSPRDSSER
ncbi:hypothetical protein BJX66DRAFT_338746 [Aspergillus keveii]|uniref:Ankyrin repeat-containing protein n=1 Tax=Aspergillus keveii TaxID=714993 RepID=A0ABR4G3H3_9EURO